MTIFSTARVLRGLVAGLLIAGASAQAETYTIGVVPQFEALRLAEIWTPIVDELEARTGHDFELIGAPNIPTFEEEFEDGLFDFAYMNPYHSIMAQNAQGYTQILRDGSRMLYGILVVRLGSPIQDVTELDGKTVAFPAPNALGASLLMRAELDMLHDVQVDASYVSTHSSAYLNTVLGAAEAAGGVKSTFDSLDEPIRENLRILYETARVPPHPIAAHPRVPVDVVAAFQQAILDLAATEEGNALLSQIPMREAVVTTPDEYQPLRDMNLEAYVVK
jgi:phosphonate transport system substrate-binding protein